MNKFDTKRLDLNKKMYKLNFIQNMTFLIFNLVFSYAFLKSKNILLKFSSDLNFYKIKI